MVKTLVTPTKFPPTIIAIPSSPNPLLKEAVIESTIDHTASRIKVKLVLNPDAPSVLARSLSCVSVLAKAFNEKLTIMGVTRIASPMAMPLRV